MKPNLEKALSAVLVFCAVVTTAVVLHREFYAPRTASTPSISQDPVYIQNWKEELARGVLLGSASAPVQLIEFADFECPFCSDLHQKLNVLQERYPKQVSLTYVHFPIQGHRFALPAARVAECADKQGRFAAMYDQLFDGQESFGLKPWSAYASAAGVPDLATFDVCISATDAVPRIEQGKALGKKLDVQGTPTLIINGWKLGHTPSPEELDAMVKAVLAGKDPISGAHKS